MPKLVDLKQEMERRLAARAEFIPFVTYTKPDYQAARHHHLMAGYLEAVLRGELDRLVFTLPPRHGKSELVTRRFPAWFLGLQPDKFVISASYNDELATDFGREVRQIVDSQEYRNLFPNVQLRPDSRAANRWNTSNGGAYFAAGIREGITGRGMHLGIIDDPVKDMEEALSAAAQERIWRWYKTAFRTRMMPNAAIVIAMTRWVKNDLVGRIQSDEPGRWVVINLPALAEDGDPLGRVEGEPLWPEWYGTDVLIEQQDALENREFAALYQGKPTQDGGNVFKSSWWRYYKEVPPFEAVVQFWDTAFETGDRNSYSVCGTWGVGQVGYYLLHVFRKRLEFPELIEACNQQAARFRPQVILVEKRASGASMIQEMERKSRWPVLAINVVKDKEARARAVTYAFQAGRVLLPELAPWVDAYTAELEDFPGGKFDDQVDMTSGALTWLQENYSLAWSSQPGPGHNQAVLSTPQPEVLTAWNIYAPRGGYH